jgi:predicted flap endonuclease-1-like 5' DNA nuclease
MGQSDEDISLGIRHPLPISKLRGVPPMVRLRLKSQRITTCGQLLLAAGDARRRADLLATTGIDEDVLLRLVRRADMARIRGIGTVFGLMLEELGVADVEQLARQTPGDLHAALRAYNLEERLARRSPTMEEVVEWIETAQSLPIVVSYSAAADPNQQG